MNTMFKIEAKLLVSGIRLAVVHAYQVKKSQKLLFMKMFRNKVILMSAFIVGMASKNAAA